MPLACVEEITQPKTVAPATGNCLFRRHADKRSRADHPRDVSSQLQIRSLRHGNTHVVAPAGELDLDTAQQLEDELTRVEATDVPTILLDLRGVGLVDSCGMKVVIRASARAGAARLGILRGSDSVHRPFEMMGLATRLPFIDVRPP